MPRVNLLYVITKLELGGAQKQLLSLISRLDPERLRIFLFTAREGLLLQEALSIKGLIVKRSNWLERPVNPLKDLLAFFEIRKFIKKNHIDIVHTHSSKAGIVGRLAAAATRAKIIIHSVHGWSFNGCQNFFVRSLFIWLERITARVTHKIIVVSNHDKEKGLGCLIGKISQYQLIRYGIDYGEFDLKNQDLKPGSEQHLDTAIIGMIACFKPQKHPQDFIRLAFLIKKILPLAKFILVGDGILRKKIERSIERLDLKNQVVLTGWRRDIPRILSSIDVFALTSLWEGMPVTVLEAMSLAKPVVATDTGGVREVIKEGETGFLVPVRDIKAMSEKIVSLLRNRQLRIKMGKAAKESLREDYNMPTAVSRTQNVYLDLIKEKDLGNG
ncbi:MAG: glycosyltransferase family 4 protein [Candidatus Omnitrophica bacterium]|nr:glycosyltransferase family 4 protein [Candidatus Omnitrophota bacterium]